MRPITFPSATLKKFLLRHKIAALPDLKRALGTSTELTVFRKLKQLHYLSSYTHRGSFYTLPGIARFDANGLWSFRDVWFSRHGTLLATAEAFIRQSPRGYFADELAAALHTDVQDPLRILIQRRRLRRSELGGLFLYTSPELSVRRQQILARKAAELVPGIADPSVPRVLSRRTPGGHRSVPQPPRRTTTPPLRRSGIAPPGPRGRFPAGRTARPGCAYRRPRPSTVTRSPVPLRSHPSAGCRTQADGKKTPEILKKIELLLEQDTAGDPISGLKWTRKTTARIAAQLKRLRIRVSPRTVSRLLHKLRFSLRVNRKKVGPRHPLRETQFAHIGKLRQRFRRQGNPVISADAKKRELVGNFKNAGVKWDHTPTAVNDHDFRSQADGIAVLYGIYDLHANRGTMFVGVSHETSAFAVASISTWWQREGSKRYPGKTKLLILADTGGSNSATRSAWKDQLQQFSEYSGLSITVAHYPTGASKYNPIERRLFSVISRNWAGEPLRSYEKILKFIRTTVTATGLKVRAYLDRKNYPVGVKPSADRLRQLRLTRNKVAPKWNYTIVPSNVK